MYGEEPAKLRTSKYGSPEMGSVRRSLRLKHSKQKKEWPTGRFRGKLDIAIQTWGAFRGVLVGECHDPTFVVQ